MADKSEEKQTWWRTLPGILTAITGLAIGLNQAGLLGGHVSPATTPASTALAGPANSSQPPTGVPLIGLPAVSADWRGFPVPSYARCDGGDPAVVIAETTQSKLVICHGPNDPYYRGMGNNTTDGIELRGAARASGGYNVTNTEYQIRPDALTISMPGQAPWSEPMLQYASI